MVMRWVLAVAACGLIGAGCGDDSSDDTPKAGTSTNTAGKSGSGMAGGGMAGSGSGNTDLEMAIVGACAMKEELEMCMGVDAFTACGFDDCGGRACADGGCKAWSDCIAAAADPCKNNCTRSAACNACGDPVYKCLIDDCLEKLDCSN